MSSFFRLKKSVTAKQYAETVFSDILSCRRNISKLSISTIILSLNVNRWGCHLDNVNVSGSVANSHYEKFPDGTVKCIDEEIPFEIPQGWVWARIFHVFSLQAGKNIKASEISVEQTETHPYPCFGGNGLRGYVGYFNNEGEKPLIGRQGALCGNLNMSYGHFFATEHAVVVDCFASVKVRWAYYTLMALNLNQYATATAQPGLAVSNIIKVFIPVPPIEEQCRIINTIDKLTPEIEAFNEKETRLNELNVSIRYALRKSILQEAIQGRLVTQESDEEPASVLLRRIRIEKQKLLKEGKIKRKDIVDSVIFKGEDNKYYEKVGGMILDISEEISFEIPNSWQWVRLGTLFSHNTGKALNRADTDGIKKKYLTTSNVYWNRFDFNEVREMFFTDPELEKCTVHKGDLLVCEGGDIGRSAIWQYDEEICIQNHIHRLRAYYPINTEFYYLVIYHYKNIGNIGGKGIGIQGLSSGALHRLIVPLPPIEEQYRITHKYNSLIASTMRK